jgi:hypothetical protein
MDNGEGVMVRLTDVERKLIREAFGIAGNNYVYTPGEREIINNLIRRVPAPRGDK